MSKSREQRIASCDELLEALEQMSHAMSDSGIIDPETLVCGRRRDHEPPWNSSTSPSWRWARR